MRTCRLDRSDIRIQISDRADHLAELRIAQVRMDLRRVGHARSGQTERTDGPVQVRLLLGITQRQQFAQRGFIHLNDGDAGILQVHRLIPDCQGNLIRGVPQRLIVAYERPREDGHRPGQHALDMLLSQ
ncbi:Uncharacterised protein [Mycobacteroides abscessus subsp. abscessus]|nr:Uncharacterised protein [Mycobacteroides abscessus subsp. abscessus]